MILKSIIQWPTLMVTVNFHNLQTDTSASFVYIKLLITCLQSLIKWFFSCSSLFDNHRLSELNCWLNKQMVFTNGIFCLVPLLFIYSDLLMFDSQVGFQFFPIILTQLCYLGRGGRCFLMEHLACSIKKCLPIHLNACPGIHKNIEYSHTLWALEGASWAI